MEPRQRRFAVPGAQRRAPRLAAGAQLAFYRNVQLPFAIGRLQTRIAALQAFAATSEPNQRVAQRALMEFSNTYKSSAGKLIGLRDDRLMARKQNFERKLRSAVERDHLLDEWNEGLRRHLPEFDLCLALLRQLEAFQRARY